MSTSQTSTSERGSSDVISDAHKFDRLYNRVTSQTPTSERVRGDVISGAVQAEGGA